MDTLQSLKCKRSLIAAEIARLNEKLKAYDRVIELEENDGVASRTAPIRIETARRSAEPGLFRHNRAQLVRDAVAAMGAQPFITDDIVNKIRELEPAADIHKPTLSAQLFHMKEDGHLVVVEPRVGNRPAVYRRSVEPTAA